MDLSYTEQCIKQNYKSNNHFFDYVIIYRKKRTYIQYSYFSAIFLDPQKYKGYDGKDKVVRSGERFA